MRLHIAKYEPNRIGGGWRFADNFAKAFGQSSYEDADIYFIPSASMVSRSEVEKAFDDGKKIVLRIDNAIRNSRNRNSGMSRMYDMAQMADKVIFQSQWAKEFLTPFLNNGVKKFNDSPVILNGIDLDIYKQGRVFSWDYDSKYLYVRSSRDEGKQWVMAWYWFVNNPGTLEIVGKFSPDNLEYNFDFFNNEQYTFLGMQENMADVYRRNKYFLYTYLNDACSNTLIEALACGCKIVNVYGMAKTGGAPEIMKAFRQYGREYLGLERMAKEYLDVLVSATT